MLTLMTCLALAQAEPAPTIVLAVDTLVPRGEAYRSNRVGLGLSAGYWHAFDMFALEPRARVRYGFGSEGDASYLDGAFDIALMVTPNLRFLSPFAGGGLGARYLFTREPASTVATGKIGRAHV